MGKLSRTKGHAFERFIANIFKDHGFPDAKRHLEYQAEEALEGVDIEGVGPFRVQCKKLKKYAPLTCIEEIKAEGVPLLITAADFKPSLVALRLNDFIKILDALNNEMVSSGPSPSVGLGASDFSTEEKDLLRAVLSFAILRLGFTDREKQLLNSIKDKLR